KHLRLVDGDVQRLALELHVASSVVDTGPAGLVVQIETGTADGQTKMFAVICKQTIQWAVQIALDGGAAGRNRLRQPGSQFIERHVRRPGYMAEQGRG